VENKIKPTLIRDDGVESFWRWNCLPASQLTVRCSKPCKQENDRESCHESDDTYGYAGLTFDDGSYSVEFDDEMTTEECDQRREVIKKVIADQSEVCVLSTFLQDDGPEASMEVLYKLKTKSGTWAAE
jgi:hypothetical protein